jgi:HAD superfamily hydrolase (TIGR01450 family)
MQDVPETSIAGLLDRYDAFLLDAYGVLVTASGAIPGAPAFVQALNDSGKPYFVLTNDASKLPETGAARYRGFGVPLVPERIITSGTLLAAYFAEHRLAGARCVVIGPADSARYVEFVGGEVVPAGSDFEVLVVGDETGFPFLETVDATLSALIRRLDRGDPVHLVLPNPDLIFPRGLDHFGIAAGSVAMLFEAALQLRYPDRPQLRFARLGKPHAPIFEEGLRRCGTRNAVMIGDTLETDIRGANRCGIDSVLLHTGVTRPQLSTFDGVRPTYLMRSLLAKASRA